jgi:hypothetical protein
LRDNSPMSTNRTSAVPPGVDGVEIKVTLGAEMVERGRQAFRIGLAQAERRSIWFVERPVRHGDPAALPLLSRGVIIRIRQREGEDDDATLKLRGPEGCIDPDLWRRRTGSFGKRAKLEGKRHLLAASLDGKIAGGRIEEVVAEQPQQVKRLLSEAQQALAEEWLLPLEEVQLLGPVRAAKWRPGTGSWATSRPSCGRSATGCASSSCRCWPRTTRSATSSAWTSWSGATRSRSTQRRKPRPAPCLSTSRRSGPDHPERTWRLGYLPASVGICTRVQCRPGWQSCG